MGECEHIVTTGVQDQLGRSRLIGTTSEASVLVSYFAHARRVVFWEEHGLVA
jgi:hypothetical protein